MITDERVLAVVGNNAAYRVRISKCRIIDDKCVGCSGCGKYPPCKIKQVLEPNLLEEYWKEALNND